MGEEDQAPSQDEQKELVKILQNKPLILGETWYLVDATWMKSLKLYLGISERPCRNTHFHPGPIDNRNLLNSDNTLKNNLSDGTDYELVPQELWDKLVEWYGMEGNQTPIARRVTQLANNYLIVEVYLVRLRCSTDFSMDPEVIISFSRTTTMKSIDEELRIKFGIAENAETRLWLNPPGVSPELVEMDKSLSEVVVGQEGNCCVIESKKPNSKWSDRDDDFSQKNLSTNDNDLSSYSNAKVSRMTTPYQPGICGLSNLGNTCFMNSVLQCMSNCPPVTEYFLARRHLEELNKVNPLGMRGEIAVAFGNLIGTMWSGNHPHYSPIQFKIQLGKFNPVFSGCQQHDSQELPTFLLDGLHEDLNRIKQKPYTTINDDSDREDKILAQEAWDRHRKRNDSIIVDTFHGLLKSRVVCPDCKKLSVTFDPFCNLSLPLPQKKDRLITITFIPFEGSEQIFKCRISIPRQGTIKDLCFEVAQRTSTEPNSLMVSEISHSHFHQFYSGEDTLDNIHDRDLIYVYEVPALTNAIENKPLLIPVCLWEVNENSERFDNHQLFGIPFFINSPRLPMSENDLRNLLLDKMQRHFNIPALNGCNMMDTDNGSADFVNKTMKDNWFRIYTKNTAARTPPTLIEFKKKRVDLTELFDVDDDEDETYVGRNILLLGFTKELKRDVYIEKSVEYLTDKSYNYRASREMEKITMNDCLNLFTTCEKLGADDAWYCPTCKKHQRATKKFDLWDLPKILIVHLKRFSYTRLLRDKIDAMVDCPLKNLDMSQYLIKRDRPQSVYNLIGVCNHYGGMGGGHYTASCKNKDTGEWYYFDDSNVESISEDRVLTKAAYVLFYMATDPQ
uniref:Ubiquitin carboxyl-terminal hydrolase n=1 Tax=Lygus hesperus TaxID=30085 RepID=A0A0K8SJI5_LYGHE